MRFSTSCENNSIRTHTHFLSESCNLKQTSADLCLTSLVGLCSLLIGSFRLTSCVSSQSRLIGAFSFPVYLKCTRRNAFRSDSVNALGLQVPQRPLSPLRSSCFTHILNLARFLLQCCKAGRLLQISWTFLFCASQSHSNNKPSDPTGCI